MPRHTAKGSQLLPPGRGVPAWAGVGQRVLGCAGVGRCGPACAGVCGCGPAWACVGRRGMAWVTAKSFRAGEEDQIRHKSQDDMFS